LHVPFLQLFEQQSELKVQASLLPAHTPGTQALVSYRQLATSQLKLPLA
jgi:hypothetical protein